jgi:hypothetical protein
VMAAQAHTKAQLDPIMMHVPCSVPPAFPHHRTPVKLSTLGVLFCTFHKRNLNSHHFPDE